MLLEGGCSISDRPFEQKVHVLVHAGHIDALEDCFFVFLLGWTWVWMKTLLYDTFNRPWSFDFVVFFRTLLLEVALLDFMMPFGPFVFPAWTAYFVPGRVVLVAGVTLIVTSVLLFRIFPEVTLIVTFSLLLCGVFGVTLIVTSTFLAGFIPEVTLIVTLSSLLCGAFGVTLIVTSISLHLLRLRGWCLLPWLPCAVLCRFSLLSTFIFT